MCFSLIGSVRSCVKRAAVVVVTLASLFASGGAWAEGVIYVNGAATGAGDGSSWEDAYTDVAAAVKAANEGQASLYIAKGVYTLSSALSVTNIPAIYGGFKGDDPDETVAARQYDVNKTVLSGDKTQNNYWVHIEPGAAGSYTYTKTELKDKPLFADGVLQMPPAFTADYDTYVPNVDTSDVSAALSIKNGISGVVDGLWFAGFCGNGNAIVTFTSGTKAVHLQHCRFIGNTAHTATIRNSDTTVVKNLIDCKIMYTGMRTTAPWGDGVTLGVDMGNASAWVSAWVNLKDCEFLSLAGIGLSTMYNQWTGACCLSFSQTYAPTFPCRFAIRGCRFVRSYAYQAADQPCNNIMGCTSNYASGRFADCVFSNCLSVVATTGSKGQGLRTFPTASAELTGCYFKKNQLEIKGGSARHFPLFTGGGEASRHYFDSCSFVENACRVTHSSLTDGDVTVTLVAEQQGNRPMHEAFVNCVFDSNEMDFASRDGVTPHLCRGVTAYCTTANYDSQVAIAGCTFLGPKIEGVHDVIAYNSTYNKTFNIVDSIFEYTGGEPYDGFEFANASPIKLYSCTLANWVTPDVEYSIVDHDYDWVPFATNFVASTGRPILVPAAKTPLIRQSADLAVNGTTFTDPEWMTNYAFRAYGATSWQALSPQSKALDSDVSKNPSKYVGHDASFATRPYGATTRGASQSLTPLAESGATLTLRRSPFNGGQFAGPQVQCVEKGAAIASVKAVADTAAGMSFAGWYTTDDALYSDSEALAIASLDDSLVLVAKFEAPKKKVVFELGPHGTFDETGNHSYTNELSQGVPFPEVPDYTVEPGWVFGKWNTAFPLVVPASDVTYTAKIVTTALRTIRVAGDSTAESPDGLSWDGAYRSLAEAYADAGICQGEVWMKGGRYKVSSAIPLKSNVTVRGGFAGSETRADEADPAAHPTVITGDTQLNDYWKYQTSGTAALWENGLPKGPEPDQGDNSYASCGNASDDAVRCFDDSAGAVTNVAFHGLTFACFGQEVLRFAQGSDQCLIVSNCQFFAGNGTDVSGVFAMKVVGRRLELTDCRFVGNCGAVSVSGGVTTSAFVRCSFDANTRKVSGDACVNISGAHAAEISCCVFRRTYAYQDTYGSTYGSLSLQPSAGYRINVSDCSFASNTLQGVAVADVYKAGDGRVVLERCRFQSILYTGKGQNMWSDSYAAAAMRNSGGDLLVRDSSFARCSAVSMGGVADNSTSSILGYNSGVTTFVNDTFDDCSANATGYRVGLFGQHGTGGKVGIVNCLFNGTKTSGANCGFFITDADTKTTSFNVLNTAIVNSSNDFRVAYLKNNAACLGFANCVVDNFDATALPSGSNGYFYDVTTNTPVVVDALRQGANGAWARVVRSEKSGRRVWLKDGVAYFRDEVANPDKPWRKATDKAFFAASVEGLPAMDALLPNAYGEKRVSRRSFFGPATVKPGLLLLVR